MPNFAELADRLPHDHPRLHGGRAVTARLLWQLLFGASLAGLAIAIVSLSQGMRAVMEIGGSCGDDLSYGVYQPCPDGVTGSIMLGVFGGLLAAAVSVLAGWRARAPHLGLLAWPAMFGILGWNFLDYGRGSTSPDGLIHTADFGLIICGLTFEAMAIIPTLLLLYFATIGRHRIIKARAQSRYW